MGKRAGPKHSATEAAEELAAKLKSTSEMARTLREDAVRTQHTAEVLHRKSRDLHRRVDAVHKEAHQVHQTEQAFLPRGDRSKKR